MGDEGFLEWDSSFLGDELRVEWSEGNCNRG